MNEIDKNQYDEKAYFKSKKSPYTQINNLKKKLLDKLIWFQFGGGVKWKTFSHNGVWFPPEYVPHSQPLKYKNQMIDLKPDAEEVAMLYARYIETDYVTNKTFNKNFWNDWKKILGSESPIKDLDGCDFTTYNKILSDAKEKKKELKSDNNKAIIDKYQIAIVDGKEQPVGNFRIEPPGIFIGRGDNPNLGKLKRRIYPEDITINVDKETTVEVPEGLKSLGHKWGKVIHDKNVEWLASWKDYITGKTKYVWLGSSSDFKASSDEQKFELARKLKRKYKMIVEQNNKNLESSDKKVKESAIALWFIANLAIRVGNEKSEDKGADTVGATSLRVEHVTLSDDNQITLSFLGKDSVPYNNTVRLPDLVYDGVKMLIEGKPICDPLFDIITANDINKYLQTFMKNLSAKVFRTYNSSILFQKELKKIYSKFEGVDVDKDLILDALMAANIKVASLCNHQKAIGKSKSKDNISKIDKMIRKVRTSLRKANKKNPEKIEKLKNKLKLLKSKKEIKQQTKNLSTETSKANYIDPRLIIAFTKHFNIPIDKVFSKTLQQKFKWAMNVKADFKF